MVHNFNLILQSYVLECLVATENRYVRGTADRGPRIN